MPLKSSASRRKRIARAFGCFTALRAAQQMMGEESSVLALDQQVSEKLVSGAEDWYSAPE